MAIVNLIPAGSSGVDTNFLEYQDSHGGTVMEITTGEQPTRYHWLGLNAELIQTFNLVNWTLNDTSYGTWTPATSATQIKATTDLATFEANMATYDYALIWYVKINPKYSSGTATMSRVEGQYHVLVYYLRRQPSSYESLITDNYYYNGSIGYNKALTDYYNSSSVHAFAYQYSYGIYAGGYAPAISSVTSDTPTITVKTPTISARCNDVYFSTSSASAIDVTNSTIVMKAELYRMPKLNGFSSELLKGLSKLYHEGSGN